MLRKIASTLLFFAVVAGVVLYAAGFFGGERVAPTREPAPAGEPAPARTARAELTEIPVWESAVGTVRSRTRVQVAAQVIARIVEVKADVGNTVEKGTVLVVLDGRALTARAEQARQALAAAVAARDRSRQTKASGKAILAQSKARYDRISKLLSDKATTPQQMEDAEAAYLQAQAGVADAEAAIAAADARILEAQKVVYQAEIALGHTRIAAPIHGVVTERLVEPGDLAWSGRTLLTVLDPRALRLEADVREGLIARVRPGERFPIELPAAGIRLEGVVAEIVPSADPATRTFRVRADFEFRPGVYPGMFGRLRLPVGVRKVVGVPAAAVVRVGQLETILVHEGGLWARRDITTGVSFGEGRVEVLSGLAGGEEIGLAQGDS